MSRLRAKHGIHNTYERYARRAHPLPAPLDQEQEQLSLFAPRDAALKHLPKTPKNLLP